ncbi:MAG: protoporphyrinogen oxidase [Bacteroidota bacterium]
MPDFRAECLVLGGGIAGLTAAFSLQEAGIKVQLIDRGPSAGGVIRTMRSPSGHHLDVGANSAANHPALLDLIHALGLESKTLTASQHAGVRYIAKAGELHKVWPSPLFLLTTKLLNLGGKLRLLREPWIRSRAHSQESVQAFFTRRLGPQAYEYLINPVIGGIYAGDPGQLHMHSVMSRLVEWESSHGSLFQGLRKTAGKGPKRSILSFEGGMQQLPQTIADRLGSTGHFGQQITSLQQKGKQWVVHTQEESGQEHTFLGDQLIWALPAHQHPLLPDSLAILSAQLANTPFVSMGMVQLAFPGAPPASLERGFGFLVPEQESHLLLGAIWNSAVFPQNQPHNQEVWTLFVGGSRTPFPDQATFEAAVPEAVRQFLTYVPFEEAPVYQRSFFWPQAIPQYDLQQPKRVQAIQQHSPENFHLIGNTLSGVSVGDCIGHAQETVKQLLAVLSPQMA